jgi:hypothetical protein
MSVTNKIGEDIKVSFFQKHSFIVSQSGETQAKFGNRSIVLIKSQETESFSYNFSFKDDFKDDAFDFTLEEKKRGRVFA